MQPTPFERLCKSLTNAAFAGKFDRQVDEWVSKRGQGRLDALQTVFDNYQYANYWDSSKPVIAALRDVPKLDEDGRARLVPEVRAIVTRAERQQVTVTNEAMDVLCKSGEAGLWGIREVAPLCKQHAPTGIREKALETVAELGLRIIDKGNQVLFGNLAEVIGDLGKQCSSPRSPPRSPEDTLRAFAILGIASFRSRLEPMASAVAAYLQPIERAAVTWHQDEAKGLAVVSCLRRKAESSGVQIEEIPRRQRLSPLSP